MIQDPTMFQNLRQEWHAVRDTQSMVQRHLNAAASSGGLGVAVNLTLRDVCHSLVILFAFSVLEEVLTQLRDEGNFTSGSQLGALMHASKSVIPWVDFNLVDKARQERNKVAHDQKILPRGDCWKYIDAIEAELLEWGILSAPIGFKHGLSGVNSDFGKAKL